MASSSLELPKGIRTKNNNRPEISKYFNESGTPYINTDQVISEVKVRYIGQVFNVNTVEYCFEKGTGDGDLVEKLPKIDAPKEIEFRVNGGVIPIVDNVLEIPSSSSGIDEAILDPNTGKLVFKKDDDSTFDVDLAPLLPVYRYEGTYAEIKALKDAGKLIEGVRYILTDYQTEYFILGSNSSSFIRNYEVTSTVASYGVISYGLYVYDLKLNDDVTVTGLPLGYVGDIMVGDTTRVTYEYADYYFRFANNMHLISGFKFSYSTERYGSILADVVVNDPSGKPILKPQGVINTEVHDGTAYMDQSSDENLAVPTERLILIASSNRSFRKDGESDTFKGDYIEYDFDDDAIKNDNGEIIGSRRGIITKRATFDRKIDLPIDWRVVRFRRWLLSEQGRISFSNRNLDPLTTRVGHEGKFLFEPKHRKIEDVDAFYIARTPEGVFQNIDENAMRTTFIYEADGLGRAKDFCCFPLDSEYIPVGVGVINVTNGWYNTVIQGIGGGEFNYLATIEIDGGTLSNTTFVSNPKINNGGDTMMSDCTFLDSTYMGTPRSTQYINCQFLSHVAFEHLSHSEFSNTIFATIGSRLPGMNSSVSWNILKFNVGAMVINSVFSGLNPKIKISNTQITDCSFFMGDSRSDGTHERNSIIFSNANISSMGMRLFKLVERVIFKDITTPFTNNLVGNPNGLFLYDYANSIERRVIEFNRYNYNLYTQDVDTNDQISLVTLMSPIPKVE